MSLPSFTDQNRGYDVVKMELDQLYTRTAGTLKNLTGGAVVAGAIRAGSPLNLNGTQWETINVGQESTADGILVDSRPIPALGIAGITELEYQILVRGPALVNLDAIAEDPDGTTGAYTAATLEARLLALVPPIIVLREPVTQGVQTT